VATRISIIPSQEQADVYSDLVIRTLLNDIPDWGLFLIFVGGATIVTIALFLLVRRHLPAWRTDGSSGVVGAVAAMVMTLFALVLAFVVVNLYQGYQDATNNVVAEANSLAEIVHDTNVFPKTEQNRVDVAVASYVHEVIGKEFEDLRLGHQDPAAFTKINGIFTAIQQYSPTSEAAITFYGSAVEQASDVVSDHRNRVLDADSSLPTAFVALLILTALLSIGTAFFFKADNPGLEIMLLAIISIVIFSGLLTVVLLEYPFSGSVAVSSDPFTQGALGQLLAAYP
jgi:Protein of unknown function (DUF4239)